MAEPIRPYKKEADRDSDRSDEDEFFTDKVEEVGAPRFALFGKVLGVTITVAINIGIFVVINFFYKQLPFLTEEFPRWLPFANVSLVVGTIMQILALIYSGEKVKPLFDVISNIFAFFSVFMLWFIFPFDFDSVSWIEGMETFAKILLMFATFAIVIAVIANTATFISSLLKQEE